MQRKTSKNKFVDFDISRLIPILKERSAIYEKQDSVYISVIHELKKSGDKKIKIKIKITEDIVNEFDWQPGDLISAYHDPDHVRKLYFMKAENGYKLSYTDGFYQFEVPWKNKKIILEKCGGIKIEKEIIPTKYANILSIVI